MTQTSEATQESVTTTAKLKMLYCIEHGCMVKIEQGERGLRHPMGDWKEEPTFCYFPLDWATCPPEAIEVGEGFFDGDWAAQDELDDFCPDEVGMWEES